jgi:formylglycine-generating enzyme
MKSMAMILLSIVWLFNPIYATMKGPERMIRNDELAITLDGDAITLTWSNVADAINYRVYSSEFPDGIFELDSTGQFDGNSWSSSADYPRRFYFVTYETAADVPIPPNFVYVDAGTIVMNDMNYGHQMTAHITGFYIDAFELTQASYESIMGANPSHHSGDLQCPVEQVSWFDAIEYCNRRSISEGLTPAYSYSVYGTDPDNWYTFAPNWNTLNDNHSAVICNWSANGYRLPTEAEWMFAAKGGNQTPESGYPNWSGTAIANQLTNYAWYSANNTPAGTKAVGTKLANQTGIFDMSGNVYEWVWDFCSDDPIYPEGEQTDPRGPSSGAYRQFRGGAFQLSQWACVIWAINYGYPTTSMFHCGFRIVRTH